MVNRGSHSYAKPPIEAFTSMGGKQDRGMEERVRREVKDLSSVPVFALISHQAIFCNGDIDGDFDSITKNSKGHHIAHSYIQHHINQMVLT